MALSLAWAAALLICSASLMAGALPAGEKRPGAAAGAAPPVDAPSSTPLPFFLAGVGAQTAQTYTLPPGTYTIRIEFGRETCGAAGGARCTAREKLAHLRPLALGKAAAVCDRRESRFPSLQATSASTPAVAPTRCRARAPTTARGASTGTLGLLARWRPPLPLVTAWPVQPSSTASGPPSTSRFDWGQCWEDWRLMPVRLPHAPCLPCPPTHPHRAWRARRPRAAATTMLERRPPLATPAWALRCCLPPRRCQSGCWSPQAAHQTASTSACR